MNYWCNSEKKMPTVLGGGLSGLSAGYYLSRRFVNPVTLYEASNRVGGWIRSEAHDDKKFIFETGPRTIRPKGPTAWNTLELISDLNLDIDPIYADHPAAKNRMIFAKGKLCMLPNSMSSMFKTIPPFSKPLITSLFHDLRAVSKKQKLGDESLFDFTKRRFGIEVAEYAISALVCGICAGDARQISVRFLMNDLFEREQKWGGVIKGSLMGMFNKNKNKTIAGGKLMKIAKENKWSMYRLRGGIETLPKALANYLENNFVQVNKSTECKDICFNRDEVHLNINGSFVETDHIISSLPSHKLAPLVESQHPALAYHLKAIPYVDVAVVNLQYATENLLEHDAFGFLVPPVEQLPILGIIFDSCCFEMRGNTIITVMMGGRWFEENFGKNPTQKQLLDIALENVKNILKISYEPNLARVHILRKCIPQYTVGHKARIDAIRNYIKKYKLQLSVCGAAYDGVGVNDVIFSAKTQVDSLVGCGN